MKALVRGWRRFWFDFAIPANTINLLRIAFFSVLALDFFLRLGHAPRYGAGDFNVAHFAALDTVLPIARRGFISAILLVQCYLAARIVLGVAIRSSVVLLTVLFGYTYFSSQLDAFQHHYLLFLLLLLSCFVPWDEARRDTTAGNKTPIPNWALRLIYVQLALLYFWAAVAKWSPLWLDGTTLQRQLTVDWVAELVERLFGAASPGDPGGFAVLAKLIMIAELGLAAGIFWRKAWPVVWFVGLSFHIGVELAGFKIGLFSYFMMAIYVLFIPPSWLAALVGLWTQATRFLAVPLRRLGARIRASPVRLPLIGIAVLGGGALWIPMPFETTGTAIALVTVAGIAAIARDNADTRLWTASKHLVACALVLGFHLATNQAFDYYKYLAGTSRRLGDTETMQMAYTKLTQIAPEYGPAYYHLGNSARDKGNTQEALDFYRSAELREPADERPFRAEAEMRRKRGELDSALAVLEQCQAVVPDSKKCASDQRRYKRRDNDRGSGAQR